MLALRTLAGSLRTAFFSQYAEDAMFLIAFNPNNSGFYVDVGAYHPIDGSNTYKLYRKGWHGVTIEPNPATARLFNRLRPRDHHVCQGVAASRSQLMWHEFAYPTMNTLSRERADHLRRYGFESRSTSEIICRPLQEILDDAAPDRHIDFLSIDCEGMDFEALQSLDFARSRPTAILIEDLDGYYARRDGKTAREIEMFLRSHDYNPVSHLLYSSLYIARDWRTLITRSAAFEAGRIQSGLLP
jgi:FkbM family methyltransferase